MPKKHGTVVHHVLEGTDAVAFVGGEYVAIDVDCRIDTGKLQEPVRFGLAVSLEMAATIQANLHTQMVQALRLLLTQPIEVSVQTPTVQFQEEGRLV